MDATTPVSFGGQLVAVGILTVVGLAALAAAVDSRRRKRRHRRTGQRNS